MAVSRRLLARSVVDQLLEQSVSVQDIAQRLAAYLIQSKQANRVDELIGEIAYELSLRGTVEATVTTARPLDSELRTQVIDYIKAHENGVEIQLNEVVDATILGGIIIETPSMRYDASAKGTIKQLKSLGKFKKEE